MSLFTRLTDPGPGEVKIPVHSFMACIAEGGRGEMTRQQVIDAFNITPSEEPALDNIFGKMLAASPQVSKDAFRQILHDALILSEARILYFTAQEIADRLDRA